MAGLGHGHAAGDRGDSSWWRLLWIRSSTSHSGEHGRNTRTEIGLAAGEHVHVLVVGGEHRHGAGQRLAQAGERRDEAVLVGDRVGCDHRRRVAGAEAERPRAVVDRERAHAVAAERADRGEAVHPADVGDDGGRCMWCGCGHERAILPPALAAPGRLTGSSELDLVEVADRAPADRHLRAQPAQLLGVGRARARGRRRAPAG